MIYQDYVKEFITPTTLFFCIVFIGYLIGKIKIYNMSLDLTAILIVAVITGFFISKFCISIDENKINTAMNLFSKLGTNLFIAAIGLSSGNTITKESGKKMLVLWNGSAHGLHRVWRC